MNWLNFIGAKCWSLSPTLPPSHFVFLCWLAEEHVAQINKTLIWALQCLKKEKLWVFCFYFKWSISNSFPQFFYVYIFTKSGLGWSPRYLQNGGNIISSLCQMLRIWLINWALKCWPDGLASLSLFAIKMYPTFHSCLHSNNDKYGAFHFMKTFYWIL